MAHGTRKPVRKCYTCPLNCGDYCWAYANPRARWSSRQSCPGFADVTLHARFDDWNRQPRVKSRKELRRESMSRRGCHVPPPFAEV